MKFVRRSEEGQILQWLVEGVACRVGPYICIWNRGNYEVRNTWLSGRVFRTSSAMVAAEMLLHADWKKEA